MVRPPLRVLLVASLMVLAGCQRQADPPGDAPTGLVVVPGEGRVVVSWNQEPGLTYWIFYRAGSSVTAAVPGVPLIRSAQSPSVVTGLVNLTQYAFVMNATNQDSPAGPSSAVMLATPRLAGASWNLGTPLTPQDLNGIAFSGSRLVAVGDAGTLFAGDYNYASTNPPGVTAWTPPTSVPAGFNKDLTAVIFTGAVFAALAADGSIVTSADGLTWASNNSNLVAGMNGIALGFVPGAVFVAVGGGGRIFTSSDLVTWTAAASTPSTTSNLFGVSFLNGIFLATGANGTLWTSLDGSNWIAQVSGTTSTLRGAAFGLIAASPVYVGVGDAGTILTSPDAVAWTSIVLTPPLSQNLRSVTFGSRFVTVGQGGAVAYSDDGTGWTPSLSGADLNRVIFTPGMYVAVGAAGANAVSK